MATGGEPVRRRRPLADDGIFRFLLPAPKPAPEAAAATSSPPVLLAPPHRLIAPPVPLLRPRPDERLFIVPPTRPSWLPPLSPPETAATTTMKMKTNRCPPRRGGIELPRSARNAGGRSGGVGRRWRGLGFERRRVGGGFVGGGNGGEAAAGVGRERERRAVAKRGNKKVWVAVEKKGEDGGGGGDEEEKAAAMGAGYAGGDERDDQVDDVDDEHDDGDGDINDPFDDIAADHELPDDGDDDGGENLLELLGSLPPPDQPPPPRQKVGTQRRWCEEIRHDIDTFTPGLLSIYESLKPSEEHKAKQRQLIDSLAKCVRREWPNAQLHLYGSCANSFGTCHSDVDVCLEIDIAADGIAEVLLTLAEALRKDGFDNVEAITSARVPIVRMADSGSGFSCDICINNLFAVANTKLLKDYAQIDERCPQLSFIVKHWAKLRGVNETYHGTLSSYAYVLMCISFLQQREPKILPCLQLQDFGAENKESIAKLLWAFFHYWAFHHDYRNDVISVRMGNTISKQEKNWTTRVGNDRHLICIEDPFETSHDLGRVVDRQTIRFLREEFERAATILQYDDDPCVALFEPFDYEL
uniref:Uncharacterized protein n=1 Tax=Leersia perrieri TaxID=77586 RepID=A0A0D9VBI8_9ORYZ